MLELIGIILLCTFSVVCGIMGITIAFPDPPDWWEKEEKKQEARAKNADPGV
jgi:hypothetical protein